MSDIDEFPFHDASSSTSENFLSSESKLNNSKTSDATNASEKSDYTLETKYLTDSILLSQIFLQPENKDSILNFFQETEFDRKTIQTIFKNLRNLSWCFDAQISIDARAASELLKEESKRLIELIFDKVSSQFSSTKKEKVSDIFCQTEKCVKKSENMSSKSIRPDVSKYDDIERFCRAFDIYLKLEKIEDENEQALHFQLALSTNEVWANICDANVSENIKYADLKSKVIEALKPETGLQMGEIMKELTSLAQESGSEEDLRNYYDRFLKISNLKAASEISDKVKKVLFAENLFFSNQVKPVQEKDTITSIFLRAKTYSEKNNAQSINQFQHGKNFRKQSNRNHNYQNNNRNRRSHQNSSFSRGSDKCNYCGIKGHSEARCFQKQKDQFRKEHRKMVKNLELMEIKMAEAIEEQKNATTAEESGSSDEELSEDQELGVGVTKNNEILINNITITIKKLLSTKSSELAEVKVTKIDKYGTKSQLKAYVDSGATISCFSEKYTKEQKLKIFPLENTIVRGFDGEISKNILGRTQVTIEIANVYFQNILRHISLKVAIFGIFSILFSTFK